jgi:transposase
MQTSNVIFATVGKDTNTIKKFVDELPKHDANATQIKEITMDMFPSFISGAETLLPNASITFDKFLVVKMFNKALDDVRRSEQKYNPLLKSSRYVWLKNPENLTNSQRIKLESLRFENYKTAKVYQMKHSFSFPFRRRHRAALRLFAPKDDIVSLQV